MTTESDVLDDIQFTAGNGLAHILLNRPKALNALTLDKVRAMDPALRAWDADAAVHCVFVEGAGEKAFCAGGDIRVLWQANKDNDSQALRTFFGEEYRLNRLIKTYAKPYVALLDGITMGGGVGISVHGSHRVATERTLFAMPETGIGMIPDVGGTYFLPRLPGKVGLYLGLTGARLKAADCYALGIATHFVPSARRDELFKALGEQEHHEMSVDHLQTAVTCILDMFHEDPGMAPIDNHRAAIDSLFNKGSVEEILAALRADGGEWASKQLSILESKSPFALKATFRQLQLGAQLDFDRCMQIEWRATQRVGMTPDFAEGVRAVIVDKDNAPKWAHASVSEVENAAVDALFGPLDGGDLTVD
jgi:enoyl-CoA hydratase